MTALDDPTLTLIRRDYANQQQIVRQQQANVKRVYEELERAHRAAVEACGRLLEHIDSTATDDSTELAYGALAFVYAREKWHETPHDADAFADMDTAYEQMRAAVDEYNLAVFEGEK